MPVPRHPIALQALEKDGGAKFTWQEYRVHMLDWLDAIGCRGTGVTGFLNFGRWSAICWSSSRSAKQAADRLQNAAWSQYRPPLLWRTISRSCPKQPDITTAKAHSILVLPAFSISGGGPQSAGPLPGPQSKLQTGCRMQRGGRSKCARLSRPSTDRHCSGELYQGLVPSSQTLRPQSAGPLPGPQSKLQTGCRMQRGG
jgi:hypothetical protein